MCLKIELILKQMQFNLNFYKHQNICKVIYKIQVETILNRDYKVKLTMHSNTYLKKNNLT